MRQPPQRLRAQIGRSASAAVRQMRQKSVIAYRECFSAFITGTVVAIMSKITVDGVIVPPFKCGEGYGHTRDGRCVAFSGPRDAMIALCRRVMDCDYGNGEAPVITLGGFSGFFRIETGFCPMAHAETGRLAS
jgi:hypothetical protein